MSSEIFIWQEKDENDKWGTIASIINNTAFPLVSRSLKAMEKFKPLAEAHARKHNRPVALRKYVYEETIEEIK